MKRILEVLAVVVFLCWSSCASANPIQESFENGIKALSQEKFDEAIRYFQKVLEIHESFAPAYNYLGLAHKEKGTNMKEVTGYFRRAIEIDPKYAEAYVNLGKAYYTTAKFPEAEEVCRKALELNPESPTAHLALAWTYLLGMSQPDDAIKHFEKVIHLTEMPYANFGLGLAYFMNNERLKVFDMITQLRKKGEEGFALELERIIRDKRYETISERGQPLLAPQITKISSQLLPDLPVSEIAESPEANRPVRIRKGGAEQASTSSPAVNSEPALTGEERIRKLQESSRQTNLPQY